MGRLKKAIAGFTLLEIIIALALASIVLLATTRLLISFFRFSAAAVNNEAELMGSAMGAFEEIAAKIQVANQVTIPSATHAAPSIDIRADNTSVFPWTPSVTSDDTTHTFWKSGNLLKYESTTGGADPSVEVDLANNIDALSFTLDASDANQITIVMRAKPADGPRETLETTVRMRARSAQ